MGVPSRESAPDGLWAVRSITAGNAQKVYTCPGCHRAVQPGVAHLVVWQEDAMFGAEAGLLDADGVPLPADAPWRAGAEIRYFREVVEEPVIPFVERVLYADAELVVADKPHFLPVVPAGGFVRETLLARLVARLGNPDLVPLHRIDRLTAGLVLFSANVATRGRYQSLFRLQQIQKRYEALAPALPGVSFPLERASRIERGAPFFRMREVEGVANSCTRVLAIECSGALWRYALEPVTGRKHQLRVHMAGIGAPIANDPWYPHLRHPIADDASAPLQLLAKSLAFVDPISGEARRFESGLALGGSAR